RGDQVIFASEGHLWSAALPVPPRKTATAAKKLFEIRGEVESPAWSPDGSQLAFVSVRGDHSFIGIFDPKQATIRFLEPSIDRDIEPRWSPDGRSIAYIRLFTIIDTYSADRERLLPWAIRVADAATGKGKEIWRSGDGEMDSFSRLPLGEDQMQWAAGNRLV